MCSDLLFNTPYMTDNRGTGLAEISVLPYVRKNKEMKKKTYYIEKEMGDCMLLRDGKDSNKYYLLLHLSWNSWEKYGVHIGTKVYPGMTVAGVGTQEPVVAYHLHVSVIMLNSGENPIYDEETKMDGIIINSKYSFPIWEWRYKNKMKNPFNYKDEWRGRK